MLHFKRRTEFAHFTPQQTDEAGDVVSDCNYPVEESQKPTSLPHIYMDHKPGLLLFVLLRVPSEVL